MSARPSSRPSAAEAIEATAAAWLAQRDDGLTPVEAAEFAAWRSADVRHEQAVLRLERTWTALQQLRDYRPEATRHPDRDLLRQPGRSWRGLLVGGLAASLVAAAGLWWSGSGSSADLTPAAYATTTDGYERVPLQDGSILELNGSTEVGVAFTSQERRVVLKRGEAHFTVAKDSARPFVVEAGGVVVRAVGTAFNVRLGASDLEVLVTHGKVEVGSLEVGAEAAGELPAAAPKLLAASERVLISDLRPEARTPPALATLVVERIEPEVMREALAWQEARLVFVDTPLREVVARFNRSNAVQIELGAPQLGSLPIGGRFRADNVDAFVRLIASSGDIVVERPEPNRVVLQPAR